VLSPRVPVRLRLRVSLRVYVRLRLRCVCIRAVPDNETSHSRRRCTNRVHFLLSSVPPALCVPPAGRLRMRLRRAVLRAAGTT
jgi:hypothetical protein